MSENCLSLSITLFSLPAWNVTQDAWSSSSLFVTMKTEAACEECQSRNMEGSEPVIISWGCHSPVWESQVPDLLLHEKKNMKGEQKASLV